MKNTLLATLLLLPILLALFGGMIYLLVLLCRALRKYIGSAEARQEQQSTKKALGEVLKEYRTHCRMTQEFVAETLGVSRQAVSKWESGSSEPKMSHLLALAKLYGVSIEELLRQVTADGE